ncbi:MAG TPA: zf-HC2 domain-containing protein [Chthoniobacterales bacterium]|jgi:anti-sigma factor RsiW|nr:zf-HC2 domain-containing protein [Chthoniobacterales bacterium]
MNPDKLFDYLEGKLSPNERAELEEHLMSDPQLRRELTVARQIHSEMGNSREIIGVAEPTPEERGAVLGRRIAIVFATLVFANVLFGIYAIAFMKKKEKARVSTEQNRTELAESLARTAAVALPTPSLDVEEIKFTAPVAEQNRLANKVIAATKEVGGSGTKGLADQQGVLLFAEIPTARLNDFRDSMKKLGATLPAAPVEAKAGEKTILQVRIVSAQ